MLVPFVVQLKMWNWNRNWKLNLTLDEKNSRFLVKWFEIGATKRINLKSFTSSNLVEMQLTLFARERKRVRERINYTNREGESWKKRTVAFSALHFDRSAYHIITQPYQWHAQCTYPMRILFEEFLISRVEHCVELLEKYFSSFSAFFIPHSKSNARALSSGPASYCASEKEWAKWKNTIKTKHMFRT